MAVQNLGLRCTRPEFGCGRHGRELSPCYPDLELHLSTPEAVQCQVECASLDVRQDTRGEHNSVTTLRFQYACDISLAVTPKCGFLVAVYIWIG